MPRSSRCWSRPERKSYENNAPLHYPPEGNMRVRKNRLAYLVVCVCIGILLCYLGYNRYRSSLGHEMYLILNHPAANPMEETKALELLNRGADPNYYISLHEKVRDYVLTTAIAYSESVRIVQALLEHGANP